QGFRQRRAEAVRRGRPARTRRPDDAHRVCQLRRRTGRAARPVRLRADEGGLRRPWRDRVRIGDEPDRHGQRRQGRGH
ncbi:hypothetical protein H2201_009402, partial [Coniosporium apollinis]